MSKEFKIGLLVLISVFSAFWGYRYIKGNELFRKNNTYYTTFNDVTGLDVSNMVSINGLKVGAISKILINPKDVKKMDVYFTVTGDYNLPKNTIVEMRTESLVGGKYLALNYGEACTSDCAKHMDHLKGESIGMLGSMVSTDEVGEYVNSVTGDLKSVISSLGAEGEPGALNGSIRNLDFTLQNINNLTNTLNKLMAASYGNLNATMANMNKITGNLAANNQQITTILANFKATSEELKSLKLSETVNNTNGMITESKKAVEGLQKTLETSTKAMNDINAITSKLNSGEGSMGLLLNDKTLYTNLEKTTNQMNLLLQDLRLNPKRYLNISLINRNKAYTLPEDDPAAKEKE